MLVKRTTSQSAVRSTTADPCFVFFVFFPSTRCGGGFYVLGVVAGGEKKVSCGLKNQSYLSVPLT